MRSKPLTKSDFLILEMGNLIKELKSGIGYSEITYILKKINDLHEIMEKHAGDLLKDKIKHVYNVQVGRNA